MKKLFYIMVNLIIAIFLIAAGTLKAQNWTVVQSWGFESTMDTWYNADAGNTIALSTAQAHSGTQSLKLIKSNTNANIDLQNDTYKPLQGDSLNFWVWVPASDTADINGMQVFWQDAGSSWTWHSKWVNGSSVIPGQWNSMGVTLAITGTLDRIGLQLTGQAAAQTHTDTMYVDDITIFRVSAAPVVDTTLVSMWGTTPRGSGGWQVLNTASTAQGSASFGSTKAPTGWASIKGGFSDSLTATTSQAVVVTGTLEFVGGGGGSAYTWMRYALFNEQGALSNQNTDTAAWSETSNGNGYLFMPVSGTGTISNTYNTWPQGNQGTEWPLINSKSWNSSNSNGGGPFSTVLQQPYQQVAAAGKYDFAISVQPLATGGNQVTWYFIQQHATGSSNYYWWGGSFLDTTMKGTTFNSIGYAFNNDNTATQVNLTNVKAVLGSPITVPTAPFQAFYVNKWGRTPRGTAWPVLNDSTYVDGNASMGNGKAPTAWASIKGGFNGSITATTSNAIVVTGTLEFVGGGGGSAYTWLRYALFNESGALTGQNTDTAAWSETSNGNGYLFMPVSGTGTISNTYNTWPQGNQGTNWPLINSKSWTSSNSNGGGPLATVLQAPYQQQANAGKYDFAISVQPLANGGGNQVNWYFIQQHAAGTSNYYWWGGSFIDTSKTAPTSFNSIGFACNNDNTATQVNLTNVYVNMGSPVVVPTAPFQSFYVNKWGTTPRGAAWPVLNDSTYVDGNASMGNGKAPTAWASIKGGFNGTITATTSKAILVTGTLEFVGGGGGSAYTWLRYALFNESGALTGQNTDTAAWSETSTGNGYLFMPVSGTGTISNTYNTWPQGNQGTNWPLINSKSWTSSNSNGGGPLATVLQAPYQQVAVAGKYDFAISVQPLANGGGNQVNWYFIQQHAAGTSNYYWWGGSFIDTSKTAPTAFNSIGFACNNDNTATRVNLTNVFVDMGTAITVPVAPFQSFYVNKWGRTPRGTAWPVLNDSTYIDGNASMGNGKAPTAWASIKGGFNGTITATTSKALIVTGTLEFVGGGGGSAYTWLRYALFNESGALTGQNTDTAAWSETSNGNGYLFMPVSGTGTISNTYNTWPQGNQGTNWPLINSKSWTSSNSNGGGPLATILQQPYQQQANAGKYDFAISVQPLTKGGNQVNWYFIQEKATGSSGYYWWGGSFIDTSKSAPTSFNSIGFACNNDNTATQVNLTNVFVNEGAPVVVPAAPWQDYYVNQWGFYGANRMNGWLFTPGDVDGNATISGKAPVPASQWTAIRGGFHGAVTPLNDKDSALVVSGSVEFDGGGFEAVNSLHIGLMNADSAGVVDTTHGVDSTMWKGTEAHNSGYLFLPVSGTNGALLWTGAGKNGTYGAVVNDTWLNTTGNADYILGKNTQTPGGAIGSAGIYDFAISVGPMPSGGQDVRVKLVKEDKSYYWEGLATDSHSPITTTKFNGIAFAVGGGNKTTALKLTNVLVQLTKPFVDTVTRVTNDDSQLPKAYSLSQNYPNPFNPSTTIQFALPKSGDVTLTIYDILGREVTKIVNGTLEAGYHSVQFNASNLASGVYFYRLKAGDFSNVKKLVLLK